MMYSMPAKVNKWGCNVYFNEEFLGLHWLIFLIYIQFEDSDVKCVVYKYTFCICVHTAWHSLSARFCGNSENNPRVVI